MVLLYSNYSVTGTGTAMTTHQLSGCSVNHVWCSVTFSFTRVLSVKDISSWFQLTYHWSLLQLFTCFVVCCGSYCVIMLILIMCIVHDTLHTYSVLWKQEVIGWYKLRRNSSMRVSLREHAVHSNFSRWLRRSEDSPATLFMLCVSQSGMNPALYTCDHQFMIASST